MVEYKWIRPVLKESLEEIYGEDRPGNHFSDIILCPRLRVFRDKERIPITDKELNFFTSGKAIHGAFEGLFTKYPGRFNELEVWISISTGKVHKVIDKKGLELLYLKFAVQNEILFLKQLENPTVEDISSLKTLENELKLNKEEFIEYLHENGIYPEEGDFSAHVDLYDRKTNQPYEAKTSRTRGLKEPKDFHVKQLKYYMAVLGSEWGGVFYQYLMKFDEDPFGEFPVHMTEEERQKILNEIIKEGSELQNARELGKPELARHIMNDLNLNWKCVSVDFKTKEKTKACPYYDQCYKMNFPESKEIKLI